MAWTIKRTPWVIKANDYTWDQLFELLRQTDISPLNIAMSFQTADIPQNLTEEEAWGWLKENRLPEEVEGYIRYHYPDLKEPAEDINLETLSPEKQFELATAYVNKSVSSRSKPDSPTETTLIERNAYNAIMNQRDNLQAIVDLGAPEAGAPMTNAEYKLGVVMRTSERDIRIDDLLWGFHAWSNTPKSAAMKLWAEWDKIPYKVI